MKILNVLIILSVVVFAAHCAPYQYEDDLEMYHDQTQEDVDEMELEKAVLEDEIRYQEEIQQQDEKLEDIDESQKQQEDHEKVEKQQDPINDEAEMKDYADSLQQNKVEAEKQQDPINDEAEMQNYENQYTKEGKAESEGDEEYKAKGSDEIDEAGQQQNEEEDDEDDENEDEIQEDDLEDENNTELEEDDKFVRGQCRRRRRCKSVCILRSQRGHKRCLRFRPRKCPRKCPSCIFKCWRIFKFCKATAVVCRRNLFRCVRKC